MAADNEHRLISKIIRDRDIIPALQRGIHSSWYLDDDNRKVWDFVNKHYAEYNEVPTATTVKDHYPNYKLLDVQDSIEYLLDTFVEFRRRLLTRQGIESVIANLQENGHDAALLAMERTVTTVNEQGIAGTHELNLSKNTQERFEEYKALKNVEFLGIPTGFKKIDEATAGLQGGQLITVIAPPKTGKSQVALQMAINTHKLGYVPMFQSFEMNNHEQQQRHDAMRSHIDHGRLRRGALLPEEEARYIKMLADTDNKQAFHLIDAVNGLTISALAAKIHQTKPDIVFVDGVYLMLDEVTGEMNTPQAITNVTRGLKKLAQRIDKPIIITTQTLLWKMRGGKVTADSIGYSSSFFQDSDVILGLEPVDGDEKVRMLSIVASRNCGPESAPLVWNWDTGCFHDEISGTNTCKFCSNWTPRP
jgi:replicative DNA helicase